MLLKDFYNNGIYPFEEIFSKDQEYRELGRKISDEKKYFEGILSPSDVERLESCYELFIDRSVIDRLPRNLHLRLSPRCPSVDRRAYGII